MFYKPFLIVIVGPSGVGKTTIVQEILKRYSDIRYSISATTRRPRKDELNGRDYCFLDIPTFKEWIEEDRFYEWAVVYGDYYGTLKKSVDDILNKSYNVILDLDIQGALSIKSKLKDIVTIFLSPPSVKELEKRLIERGDGVETIGKRVKSAEREISKIFRFDYLVRNEVLKDTIEKVSAIITAERHRVKRIKDISLLVG